MDKIKLLLYYLKVIILLASTGFHRRELPQRVLGRKKTMALNAKQKEKVTKEVKRHEKDTGSPEYQIALFTERIKKLTSHLKKNAKDFHSRRGLLKMVSKRKKLLDYLKKVNDKSYKAIIKKFELKG